MNRTKLSVGLLVLALVTAAVILVPPLLQDRDEPVTDESSTDLLHEDIALDAARLMTTWMPAEDFNRTAAEQRATHLMTEERAEHVVAPERPTTGQAWNQAAEHNATSVPQVDLNPHTEAEEGIISVRATWDWETEQGKTLESESEQRIYYFSFTDDGKIHDYTYETIPQY